MPKPVTVIQSSVETLAQNVRRVEEVQTWVYDLDNGSAMSGWVARQWAMHYKIWCQSDNEQMSISLIWFWSFGYYNISIIKMFIIIALQAVISLWRGVWVRKQNPSILFTKKQLETVEFALNNSTTRESMLWRNLKGLLGNDHKCEKQPAHGKCKAILERLGLTRYPYWLESRRKLESRRQYEVSLSVGVEAGLGDHLLSNAY